jgi:hypothetical protein
MPSLEEHRIVQVLNYGETTEIPFDFFTKHLEPAKWRWLF